MFGIEKKLDKRVAQEVITERILFCQTAIDFGEALGCIRLARELDLITEEEKNKFKSEAENKHYSFLREKEAQRKANAQAYKEEVAKRKKELGLK